MDALALIDTWPVSTVGVAAVGADGVVARHGTTDCVLPMASVSKLVTAWSVLIAVEEGVLALDDPVEPPGATIRHLLAHAAGYAFDGPDPVARPGVKRVYSNTGYEVLGAHLTRASGIDIATYVTQAVLVPLGMTSTDATGSPAKGFRSTVDDLARFAQEMLRPTLVSPATAAEATRVQFADLGGILPGVGRFSPNPWGLGPEIRDAKQPHWTGTTNSPATFGHFGGSGTFLWVDPTIGHACVMLSDREFGEWALAHWPPLSDAVVTELGGGA